MPRSDTTRCLSGDVITYQFVQDLDTYGGLDNAPT